MQSMFSVAVRAMVGKRGAKALFAAAILAAMALVLAACGGGNGGTDDVNDVKETPAGTVTITLWHSMGAPLDGALQRIANEFNDSQTQYEVELIYQGSYTESLTKLRNSVGSGDVPALIQLDDVSTQIMLDSEAITPVQKFVDEEEYDLSDFEPKALDYYRIDDVLSSMPFNMSGPILYYDKDAFEDAGLDPEQPPETLEEVREYAERLVVRDEAGEVTRYGISLQISPWLFEQMLAKQGALYVNNSNGREGRATEALFDSEEGKRIIEWWIEMVADELAWNAGRSGTDSMLKLASQEAAMAMESTAALSIAVVLVAALGEDPERIGTGPLPAPEGDGGIVLGGASLWILKDRPEHEQQGAWEFIKFASSPEQQARWHAETGYFPSRVSSYDLPPALARREEFPQFETAIEQLQDSPSNRAAQGALLGPFNLVRDRVVRAFEQALAGSVEPGAALEEAASEATNDIEGYNRVAPD